MAKHSKSQLVGPNGGELIAPPVDHADELFAESERIAYNAAQLPVEEWTQAHRFAVCVVAGAALCYKDGVMQTRYPCNITPKPAGGWTVTEVTTPTRSQETEGVALVSPPNLLNTTLARVSDYDRKEVVKMLKNPCVHCGAEGLEAHYEVGAYCKCCDLTMLTKNIGGLIASDEPGEHTESQSGDTGKHSSP